MKAEQFLDLAAYFAARRNPSLLPFYGMACGWVAVRDWVASNCDLDGNVHISNLASIAIGVESPACPGGWAGRHLLTEVLYEIRHYPYQDYQDAKIKTGCCIRLAHAEAFPLQGDPDPELCGVDARMVRLHPDTAKALDPSHPLVQPAPEE